MLKSMPNKIVFISIMVIGLLFAIVGLFYSSFALTEPVRNISFTSEILNYDKKEPGSFKVEKSAKWIAEDKAQITYDLDTVLDINDSSLDLILVLDVSSSMTEERLSILKDSLKELAMDLLINSNNRISLITFSEEGKILSTFTNSKEQILSLINSISIEGHLSSYYQGLLKVEDVLKYYQPIEERKCNLFFISGGSLNKENPNQVSEYKFLKNRYPFLNVQGIQYFEKEYEWYESHNGILKWIAEISDSQKLVDEKNIKETLFELVLDAKIYEKLELMNLVDDEYFEIEDVSSIKSSFGNIQLDDNKIIWNLNGLETGKREKLTIDLSLKEKYRNEMGYYPVGLQETVFYKIMDVEEVIETKKTPILSSHYEVKYDNNLPKGCSAKNVLDSSFEKVYSVIGIRDEIPTCDGYQFRGWKINNSITWQVNEDYFSMPEHDVVLSAEWSNLSLSKSMNGEIFVVYPPILQNTDWGYGGEFWKYKEQITKVVFQNEISPIHNTKEIFDVSAEKNQSVLARLVTNEMDTNTYTVYIQGEGGVIANKKLCYMFGDFKNLISIEGLENFDTSNVDDMSDMFIGCESLQTISLENFDTHLVWSFGHLFTGFKSLKTLDLSNFDTSSAIYFDNMFNGCESLTSLDLSNFDTSNVITMKLMFYQCSNLIELNLNGFNTSNVTDMGSMFENCYKLISLDFSNFDTRNVTNMNSMFANCNKITNLDFSNFDTKNVTNMGSMFCQCWDLINLNISNFNTSNVTNMSWMFDGCRSLSILDVTNFDTKNVTNMAWMFSHCSNLTKLEVGHFNTSKVTNMEAMFDNLKLIENLDVSNFDTSNVTNMRYMFIWDSKLNHLDVSNFDTSNVVDMSYMFSGCLSLQSLDVSHFNTSKATDMQYMFSECISIEILDMSNFNTSNVINMNYMFNHCENIANLDLSSFDTSKVVDMNSMFNNCLSLQTLELSNFDTSQVVDMSLMFRNCSLLTTLDLSSFEFSRVVDVVEMFSECQNLSTTLFINSSLIANYSLMFSGAATYSNAQIVVDYNSETVDLVDNMIATKSNNSNVVKGSLLS